MNEIEIQERLENIQKIKDMKEVVDSLKMKWIENIGDTVNHNLIHDAMSPFTKHLIEKAKYERDELCKLRGE